MENPLTETQETMIIPTSKEEEEAEALFVVQTQTEEATNIHPMWRVKPFKKKKTVIGNEGLNILQMQISKKCSNCQQKN